MAKRMQQNNKTRRAKARRHVIAMRRRPRRKFDALPSCYSAIIRALPFPAINLRALLCPPPRKIRLLACHEFPRKGRRGLHVVDRQGRFFDRRSRLTVRHVSPTPPSAMLPLLVYFSILRPPFPCRRGRRHPMTLVSCYMTLFFPRDYDVLFTSQGVATEEAEADNEEEEERERDREREREREKEDEDVYE